MIGIDLCCGLGGFSFGMQAAGITPVGAVDSWDAACRAYRGNFPDADVVCGDISSESTQELIIEKWGGAGLYAVCGGPPCQSFSNRNMSRGTYSHLPVVFARVAARLRPAVICMEEVPCFASARAPGGGLIIDQVMGVLAQAGYRAGSRVLNASDFGVPQNRKRLIVLAVLEGSGGARLMPPPAEDFPVPRVPRVSIRDVIPFPYRGKPLDDKLAAKVEKAKVDRNPFGYNVADAGRPAPTLTTRFNVASAWYVLEHDKRYYRFGISDGLILQGLPKGTELSGKINADARLVGNSVPPGLVAGVLRWASGQPGAG